MKFGLKQLLLTSALASVLAPTAWAQENSFDRSRHQSVVDRPQPEYDPEVIHVGSFTLSANALLALEHNDNVLGQASFTEDSLIARVRPEVVLSSNWSVHALSVGAHVDHREYLDLASETSTDYGIFADGRLDATRNLQLNANVSMGQITEAHYDPSSQGVLEPARDEYVAGHVGVAYQSDRLRLEGRLLSREDTYQSIFDYRDRTENAITGRASYAISPDVAVYAQATQAEFDYKDPIFENRSGTQTSTRIGVDFELSAPFRGDISVGQVEDDKDDPAEADTEGLSLDARLTWFPTQLTTVTFTGSSGIIDPGIQEAISAERQSYSVRADHELLRNMLIFGEFGFGNYEFNAASTATSGVGREDEFTHFGGGLSFKLNKHAHLEFSARHHAVDSTELVGNVEQTVVGVGLRIFP